MLRTLRQSLAAKIGESDIRVSPRIPVDIQSNRLYDVWAGGRHMIAKEYLKPDEFETAPLREIRALELLAPLDIAPQPLFYQPPASPAGPVVVYEFLEGQMWDRRRPNGDELAQLALVWLQMNSLPTEGLWMSRSTELTLHAHLDRVQSRFNEYGSWAEAEFEPGREAYDLILSLTDKCQAAVEELADCDPPLRFCHPDNRFANVIRRPDGRLGLVDWEDSGLRDPAMDLADLFTHVNQEDLLSHKDWQAFIGPYVKGLPWPDPTLHHRIHLHLLMHNVLWLSILISEGQRRVDNRTNVQAKDVRLAGQGSNGLAGWRINQMPANERLRRYLARSLAWPETNFIMKLKMMSNVRFFPI